MAEQWKQRGGWRVAVLWVLALVAAFGCSDDGDLFAGMWEYDEEALFHSATVEGILLIKEPCVYIIDDYAWLLPGTPVEELHEPDLIFVALPRGYTRYDSGSQLIWVHDSGPIANGDRIEVIGGGIGPQLPDICSSGVARAFNVKSLTLKRCALWFPTDHWSQSGCHPTVSDPLAGLWDYDEDMLVSGGYFREGILLIEGVCVYIIDDFVDKSQVRPSIPVLRFIELPREQTHYDPDTQSIWVHDYGPMTRGDKVKLGGSDQNLDPSYYTDDIYYSWDRPYDITLPRRRPPEMCSADVESIFTAYSMKPKP